MISQDMPVEEVIERFPEANRFFLERKIMCMTCGEPFWGTIGGLLLQKGYSAAKTQDLIAECNKFIRN